MAKYLFKATSPDFKKAWKNVRDDYLPPDKPSVEHVLEADSRGPIVDLIRAYMSLDYDISISLIADPEKQ